MKKDGRNRVSFFYFFLTRSLFLPLLLSSSPLPSVPPSPLPITRRSMSRTTHFTAFKSRVAGEQEREPPGNYPARDESSHAPQAHPHNTCFPYPSSPLFIISLFPLPYFLPLSPLCGALFFSPIVSLLSESPPAPVLQEPKFINLPLYLQNCSVHMCGLCCSFGFIYSEKPIPHACTADGRAH